MNARILQPIATAEPARIVTGPTSRFALVERVVHRGDEPPLHRHAHEDLLVYVVRGDLTVHLDGRRCPTPAGTWVQVPRGTDYGYAIESGTAHLLMILTPAGAEGFLAGLHAAGSRPSLDRLVTAAARHGIEITGPPPGHE